jgi:hypothetical protein
MLEASAQRAWVPNTLYQEKYAHRDPQPSEGRHVPVSVLVHSVH